jgi:hypothetical protein
LVDAFKHFRFQFNHMTLGHFGDGAHQQADVGSSPLESRYNLHGGMGMVSMDFPKNGAA